MTAVSSSLISRSAWAARASVYAAEATSRARSGGRASSWATIGLDGGGLAGRGGGVGQGGLGGVGGLLVRPGRARRCDGTCDSSTVGRGPSLAAIAPGSIAHVLIRDVRCIDGLSDAARPHVDVRLEGDRIAAVEPHDPARQPAPGDVVIDGTGRTLLPGLIDAHAHYTFDPTDGSLQSIARRTDAEILADGRAPRPRRAACRHHDRPWRRARSGTSRSCCATGSPPAWCRVPGSSRPARRSGPSTGTARRSGWRRRARRAGRRDPAGHRGRGGRRQGRRLRGGDADDDRPRARTHRPRPAGARRGGAACHRRDRRRRSGAGS